MPFPNARHGNINQLQQIAVDQLNKLRNQHEISHFRSDQRSFLFILQMKWLVVAKC